MYCNKYILFVKCFNLAKFIANNLYNVFIYEPYYEWLIIMYVFVYIIDFGNTSKLIIVVFL